MKITVDIDRIPLLFYLLLLVALLTLLVIISLPVFIVALLFIFLLFMVLFYEPQLKQRVNSVLHDSVQNQDKTHSKTCDQPTNTKDDNQHEQ